MSTFLCVYLVALVVCNGLSVGIGDETPPPTLQRYFADMDWYPLDCSERSEGGRSARTKFDGALSDAVAAYTKESATFTHIKGAGDELGKLLVERSGLSTAAFTANYELLSTMSAVAEERRLEYVSSTVFGDATPAVAAEGVAVLEGGIWPACDYQRSSSELRARSDGPSGYTAVRDVLGHLARDFQTDGGRERDDAHALYDKVVDLAVKSIRAAMDVRCAASGRAHLRVLVPGVGLGGLLFRLRTSLSQLVPTDGCEVHVDVVGTECSPSMLVALGWVSNWHREGSPTTIHPWAWHQGNMLRVRDMYLPASITPTPPISSGGVSVWAAVVGGDVFAERGWETANASFQSWVHRQPSHNPSDAALQFDVVLTSYVVDAVTSSGGVTHTLDRIVALLRPSGHWVNFGPLQYHSEEQHPKLSAEELLAYMKDVYGLVPDRPLTSLVAGAVPYSTPPTVGLIESRHLPLLFSMGRSL